MQVIIHVFFKLMQISFCIFFSLFSSPSLTITILSAFPLSASGCGKICSKFSMNFLL